jgi:hypothetical protein
MSIEDQQLNEMVNAIQQVVNVQDIKARQEVLNLIGTGLNADKNPAEILSSVLDWCGNA